MARFGRVVTAMVTPFGRDGELKLDRAQEVAAWLVKNGSEGLVVAGTTGEAPVLTDDERKDLFKAVCEAVEVPVLAGAGTNDTPHSIEMAHAAADAGASGLLIVTPYYNRPSQAGIEAHVRAVAEATDLPIVVYDIPIRSGRKISREVIVRLATEVDNVVGLKDAAGNPGETAKVIVETPDDFEVYSGDDGLTLPLLAVGAVGVIGVATHWTGPEHVEMIKAFVAGDVEKAMTINRQLLPSFAFESGDDAPNPIPVKAMMRVLGHDVGECRLPMGPAPEGLEDRAREIWKELHG